MSRGKIILSLIIGIFLISLVSAFGIVNCFCQNYPGPDFCPGGMEQIISNGQDANGCTIWACGEVEETENQGEITLVEFNLVKLLKKVSDWKQGSVGMSDLLNSITSWKQGGLL